MVQATIALLALSALAGRAFGGAASGDPSNSKYASQWSGLSKRCQGSLATIVDNKSEISKCTYGGKLFNDVVSNTAVDADKSLVPYVQSWLKSGLCASKACDSGTVTAAYQDISARCSTEIDKQMWIPLAAQSTLLNYETSRKALCLKDKGANDNSTSYCPSEVLGNIESSGTPINYNQAKISMNGDPEDAISKVPTWTYCTPCGQGLVAPVVTSLKVINAQWAQNVQTTVDGQCGTGFADGTTPATLEDGTSDSTSTPGGASGSGAGGSSSGNGTGDGSSDGSGSSGALATSKMQAGATAGALLLSMAVLVLIRG